MDGLDLMKYFLTKMFSKYSVIIIFYFYLKGKCCIKLFANKKSHYE